VSVRALAASIGLSKDTIARAIRRLRVAGVLIGDQRRTSTGIFDTGTYLIALPEHVTLIASTPTVPQPRVRVARDDGAQLSLAIES
jgi:DNA-binding transcriptional MocR family regulator